jgi:hydrogenase maturation protease
MTRGSPETVGPAHLASEDRGEVAPVLVLAVGNVLLGDDGLGRALLERVSARAGRWGGVVEFVDGGTQGLALLGVVARRRALLVLDAVALGAAPGTVHVLLGDEVFAAAPHRGATAHEGNAAELLRAAAMVGDLPSRVAVVGVEPEGLEVGAGLSPSVERGLAEAVRVALEVLDGLVGAARWPAPHRL